jgi:hypothetical protein
LKFQIFKFRLQPQGDWVQDVQLDWQQADAMTLVAHTVPAKSHCFSQYAVILDGMIEPFWTDQLSDGRLPGGLDNGSRTAGFCADERTSN